MWFLSLNLCLSPLLLGWSPRRVFRAGILYVFLSVGGQGWYPIFQLLTPLFVYKDNVVPEVSVTLKLQCCSDVVTKSWPTETWVD